MIKVSIIIPTYNVENYLIQCLDSVVNQTLQDIEIIAINDGSTDNSLDILRQYATKDSRIKIIDQKNSGYGAAVNKGIELAQGEYIGIVEPDDFIDLKMYEKLYECSKTIKYNIIRSSYYHYYNPKDIRKYCYLNEDNKEIDPLSYGYQNLWYKASAIWSAIYKKEFLHQNNIKLMETPGASYQDLPFYIETLYQTDKIYYVNQHLYYYRLSNEGSSVNDVSKNKLYIIFDLYKYVKDRLIKINKTKYQKYLYIINTVFIINLNWNISRANKKDLPSYILDVERFINDNELCKYIISFSESSPYQQILLLKNYSKLSSFQKAKYLNISKKSVKKITEFKTNMYICFVVPFKFIHNNIKYFFIKKECK